MPEIWIKCWVPETFCFQIFTVRWPCAYSALIAVLRPFTCALHSAPFALTVTKQSPCSYQRGFTKQYNTDLLMHWTSTFDVHSVLHNDTRFTKYLLSYTHIRTHTNTHYSYTYIIFQLWGNTRVLHVNKYFVENMARLTLQYNTCLHYTNILMSPYFNS